MHPIKISSKDQTSQTREESPKKVMEINGIKLAILKWSRIEDVTINIQNIKKDSV